MRTGIRAKKWLCGILAMLALGVLAVWFIPIPPGGVFHYRGLGAVGEWYLEVKDGQVRALDSENPALALDFGTYHEWQEQWGYVARGGKATCVMKTTVRGLTMGGSEWFPRAFFWRRIDDGPPDSREADSAQLMVTVGPVSVVGPEASVTVWLTNGLSAKIQSARAECSLQDRKGYWFGQATRGIIVDTNGLAAGATGVFQFVITKNSPFATTNLRAIVDVKGGVLEGGELLDVTKQVSHQVRRLGD